MKKLLCVAIALLCATVLQAQEEEKDVTKFLGIPVDGYKPAMIEKLKAKGFTSTNGTKMFWKASSTEQMSYYPLQQTTIKFVGLY